MLPGPISGHSGVRYKHLPGVRDPIPPYSIFQAERRGGLGPEEENF